jgi:hypothetical protein
MEVHLTNIHIETLTKHVDPMFGLEHGPVVIPLKHAGMMCLCMYVCMYIYIHIYI